MKGNGCGKFMGYMGNWDVYCGYSKIPKTDKREFNNFLCEQCKDKERNKLKDASAETTKEKEKPKVVILDDNELSIAKYAEEYPENFKEISDSLVSKEVIN